MLDALSTTGLEPSCTTLILDTGSMTTAVVMVMPGTDAELWPKTELKTDRPVDAARTFLKDAGLPAPGLTLICGMHAPESARGCDLREARIRRWKELLHRTEGRPEAFLKSDLADWEIAGAAACARQCFGTVLAADSGMAVVLAALCLPDLRNRCWQEGVTIVWAGVRHIQVFLLYRERVLGLYEQHSDISREALMHDLQELRLNWLPDEQVRAAGGHGCICGDLPPEAEGFHPTWILGPRRHEMQGMGRLVSPCGDDRFDRCFGLLYGLSLGKRA